jgi:hypothetical protein
MIQAMQTVRRVSKPHSPLAHRSSTQTSKLVGIPILESLDLFDIQLDLAAHPASDPQSKRQTTHHDYPIATVF